MSSFSVGCWFFFVEWIHISDKVILGYTNFFTNGVYCWSYTIQLRHGYADVGSHICQLFWRLPQRDWYNWWNHFQIFQTLTLSPLIYGFKKLYWDWYMFIFVHVFTIVYSAFVGRNNISNLVIYWEIKFRKNLSHQRSHIQRYQI